MLVAQALNVDFIRTLRLAVVPPLAFISLRGCGSITLPGFVGCLKLWWLPLEAAEGDDIEGAFARYEAHRKPRTSVIQAISSANTWMKEGSSDTSWLYGYDA